MTRSSKGHEDIVRQALHAVPLRHAPASLEARLARELDRRLALAWWQRGFSQWPAGTRIAFVAICCSIIGFTLFDGALTRAVEMTRTAALDWTHPTVSTLTSAYDVAAWLTRVIPASWIVAGIVMGGVLYVALFGLCAAAYGTLFLHAPETAPSSAGNSHA